MKGNIMNYDNYPFILHISDIAIIMNMNKDHLEEGITQAIM